MWKLQHCCDSVDVDLETATRSDGMQTHITRQSTGPTTRASITKHDQPQVFDSGLWEPDDPIHGVEENDFDQLDPNQDGCDLYEDDEARVYHQKDEHYEYARDADAVRITNDRYDAVYKGLPKKPHVLRKVKNCMSCRAKRFPGEGPAFCCRKGKVNIYIFQTYP